MATSTGTKVQQQLGDSGLILSVSGRGYVPLNLVVDIIDSLASGASFTKSDADKVFTAYRERLEAERIAAMPKPREISAPREVSEEQVPTEPYYLYRSPVERDGTPIYPEMGYVVVHVPVTIPEENRRRYAIEALANADPEERIVANDPAASQPAGSVVDGPVAEPVSPARAQEAATAREEANVAPKIEVVAPVNTTENAPKTETTSKSSASKSDNK